MNKKFLFFVISLTFIFLVFSFNSNYVSATTNVTNCTNLTIENETYTLNQSINITGNNCLIIKNNSIVLDCQGYSITLNGSDIDNWIAVGTMNFNNITVKNCVFLQNFTGVEQDAITFLNSTNSTIFNNTMAVSGIFFNHSINANISGNTLNYTSNSAPISLFSGSNSGVVEDNNITTISMGINVKESYNINISLNNITNTDTGTIDQSMIRLEDADDGIIDHNIITTFGIAAYGVAIEDVFNVIVDLNTIITSGVNATGIFLDDPTRDSNITSNNITTSGSEAFGIHVMMNSNSNLLFNNTVTTFGAYANGVYLDEANNTNISSNIVTTSGADAGGLGLMNSNNTVATQNIIKTEDSGACTVLVVGAENNTFYDNIFNNSNETVPGFCSGTPSLANDWNTTEEVATNIMGGPNLGGNFWTNNASTGYSDTCIDSDGDYFCDTAYNLAGPGSDDTNNIDYLPLANHTNMVSACEILNVENKSYFLNQSVNVNGTCFNITANNITLNFMGFNITGNTTGYGINISGYNYSIIRNGSIINFSNGIYFLSSSSNLLTNIAIDNSKQDAIVLTNAESGNNNFTNINVTNTNLSCYDINFSTAGINGTWIININFANYTFTGAGGKVNFKEPNFGEIKFLEAINGSGHSLKTDVDIESNSIFVNSSNNVGLNKSANISLYSITFTDPKPQYSSDGSTYTDCTATTDPACSELSFSGNIFTFNLTHFTYFRSAEAYTAPESNGDDGGTGGGGGAAGGEESEGGGEGDYSEGDDFGGEAGGIPYNGTIDEITNDTVTITIGNQTFTLEIDETIEVDLDLDGLFDLKVTLLGIEDGRANLLFEDIPKPGEEPEVEKTFWQKIINYHYLPFFAIGLIVILAIILIIYFLSKKGKRRYRR